MVRLTFAIALIALLQACAASTNDRTDVLFVGNSLIYVGNLPAVFVELCNDQGKPCRAEMLARGGATIRDHLDAGFVQQALETGEFDYVVMQERGGDLIAGGASADVRDRAIAAAERLAAMAREAGAEIVVLGTYQPHPGGSVGLVRAERRLADRLNARYVSISERLRCSVNNAPYRSWYAADGLHPGSELTLLMAFGIYRELIGEPGPANALSVRAAIHSANSGLRLTDYAERQAPAIGTPMRLDYSADDVRTVRELIDEACSEAEEPVESGSRRADPGGHRPPIVAALFGQPRLNRAMTAGAL